MLCMLTHSKYQQIHATRVTTWIKSKAVNSVQNTLIVPLGILRQSVLLVRMEREWVPEMELKKVTANGVSWLWNLKKVDYLATFPRHHRRLQPSPRPILPPSRLLCLLVRFYYGHPPSPCTCPRPHPCFLQPCRTPCPLTNIRFLRTFRSSPLVSSSFSSLSRLPFSFIRASLFVFSLFSFFLLLFLLLLLLLF